MRRRTNRLFETRRCDCPSRMDCSAETVSFQTSVLLEADDLHLGATTRVGEKAVQLVVDDETSPPIGNEVRVAFPLPERHEPVRLRGGITGRDDEPRDRGQVLTVTFDDGQRGGLETLEQFLPCACRA